MIAGGKDFVTYIPETHKDLISYNDIIWGVITLDSFFLAITFISASLLNKVYNLVGCIVFLVISVVFLIGMNYHFLTKRKTK